MELFKKITQALLGVFLGYAGFTHLTTNREEFQAQVPGWVPFSADFVVLASGVAEIALGLSLLFLWKFRAQVGLITALFFIVIFPGNIAQYVNQSDAFGLDSDKARAIRLFFQPVLVLWALWSTDGLKKLRINKRR